MGRFEKKPNMQLVVSLCVCDAIGPRDSRELFWRHKSYVSISFTKFSRATNAFVNVYFIIFDRFRRYPKWICRYATIHVIDKVSFNDFRRISSISVTFGTSHIY